LLGEPARVAWRLLISLTRLKKAACTERVQRRQTTTSAAPFCAEHASHHASLPTPSPDTSYAAENAARDGGARSPVARPQTIDRDSSASRSRSRRCRERFKFRTCSVGSPPWSSQHERSLDRRCASRSGALRRARGQAGCSAVEPAPQRRRSIEDASQLPTSLRPLLRRELGTAVEAHR
jgi:hypothetical protein